MNDHSPIDKIQSRPEKERPVSARRKLDFWFLVFCITTAFASVIILVLLLSAIGYQGIAGLTDPEKLAESQDAWQAEAEEDGWWWPFRAMARPMAWIYMKAVGVWSFITGTPGPDPNEVGMQPALTGSIWVCFVCALFALPIGVGTAIFLEEFKPRNRAMRSFHAFVNLNISNLAGVPSVVYGIIGLTAFVAMFGVFGGNPKTPGFEFGADFSDHLGVADSDGNLSLKVPVESRHAEPTSVADGLVGTTRFGEAKINLIGPWEAIPIDEKKSAATIRHGSRVTVRLPQEGNGITTLGHLAATSQSLVGLNGDITSLVMCSTSILLDEHVAAQHKEIQVEFDEFETMLGNRIRIPVFADEPTTQIVRNIKYVDEDGELSRVKVLDAEEIPSVSLNYKAVPKRVEIDDRYFDEFLTKDKNVVRIPVKSRKSKPTKLRVGRSYKGFAENGMQISISGSQASRFSRRLLSRFDEMLRAEPTPARNAEMRWYYFRLPIGRGVLAGGLTLMLVVLPIVIIASQESLRAVPDSLREGALGMGATPWQAIWNITLPSAMPGIMTGSILSMSRAIGEAAPLLIICGIVFIDWNPGHLMDNFTVMPLQIYNWAAEDDKAFHDKAATGILVLLTVLFCFNALAVYIRHKLKKPLT